MMWQSWCLSCKRLFLAKRLKISIVLSLFFLICITLFFNNIIASFTLMSRRYVAAIISYYTDTGDALPSVDDINFFTSYKSIFFHETSSVVKLTSRQMCAIESAALSHPDYQINVMFNAPMTNSSLREINVKHLLAFNNVRFLRLHIDQYVKGTPVEKIIGSRELNRSRWKETHTSDILRLLTLYKYGGVYLDMDVVVAKRLDTLGGNWAARESDVAIANGALAFSVDPIGRKISKATMREIQTNYKSNDWGYNGPGAITRVLKKICFTSNVTEMSARWCGGFQVYGPELFYPIRWRNARDYFIRGELKNKEAYVYHVWNHYTKNYVVAKNSPYATLASQFCPYTYEKYGKRFGT